MDRREAFNEIAGKLKEMDQLHHEIKVIWQTYTNSEGALIYNCPIDAAMQGMDFEERSNKARAEGYRTSPDQQVAYVEALCGDRLSLAFELIPLLFSNDIIARAAGIDPWYLEETRLDGDEEAYDRYIVAVGEIYLQIESELQWHKLNRIVYMDEEGYTGDYTDEFAVVCPSLVIDRVSKEILSR